MVRHLGFYISTILAVGFILLAAPSYAGFEFISPIDQQKNSQKSDTTDLEGIESSETRSEIVPLRPLILDKEVSAEPLPILSTMPSPKMSVKTTAPVKKTPSTITNPSIVEGFATQIPLVIALQQVIPAQYQYAFADGVNPGEKVDWQGGKPWDHVVADMVFPLGMSVEITDDIVYIRRQGVTSPVKNPGAMPKLELLAKSDPVPLLPSQATLKSYPKTSAQDNLLFDNTANAEVSGLNTIPSQPSQPSLTISSDRLDLSDLSIGQPMQLIPQKQPPRAAKTVVVEKRILTAPLPTATNPPVQSVSPVKKAEILPRTSPTALSPVKDKKILLLDNMEVSQSHAESMSEDVIASNDAISNQEKMGMSEAMMSFMKSPAVTMSLWQANRGQTLRSILEKWAQEADTALIWESNYDYPLQTDIEISGDFETAVRTVLDGLADANPRPLGRLHRNQPSGQAVLVIETESLTN